MKSGFFLKRVNISANKIVNGDSKCVKNRDVQFGFIASSGKTTMDTALLWLPHRKCMVEILIGCKCYVRLLNEKVFSRSSHRSILQVCQISRSCVIACLYPHVPRDE